MVTVASHAVKSDISKGSFNLKREAHIHLRKVISPLRHFSTSDTFFIDVRSLLDKR